MLRLRRSGQGGALRREVLVSGTQPQVKHMGIYGKGPVSSGSLPFSERAVNCIARGVVPSAHRRAKWCLLRKIVAASADNRRNGLSSICEEHNSQCGQLCFREREAPDNPKHHEEVVQVLRLNLQGVGADQAPSMMATTPHCSWTPLVYSLTSKFLVGSKENVKTKHPQLLYESKFTGLCKDVVWKLYMVHNFSGIVIEQSWFNSLGYGSWNTKCHMVWCRRD